MNTTEAKAILLDENKNTVHPCSVILKGNFINLFLNEENLDLLIWNMAALSTCRFDQHLLIVQHKDFNHLTLKCEGEIASAIFTQWLNPLQEKNSELKYKRKFVSVVLVLASLVLLLGLFTFFVIVPGVAEKAADFVPIETEISIGNNLAEVYETQGIVNDSATRVMQQFCNLLKLTDKYPIRVTVLTSNELNAFAVPGGRIFVYTGLIDKMRSYPQLVALLGHEASHVIQRHSLRSISRTAGAGIFMASVFGDMGSIGSGILSKADEFKQLDYSRELETEADKKGLDLMLENQVSGQGMLDLLQLLAEESDKSPGLMKYLSTHPEAEQRMEDVRKHSQLPVQFTERADLKIKFAELKAHI